MKKLFLITTFILLSVLTNAKTVVINNIYYDLIENGLLAQVIQSPNGYTGEIVIPEHVIYEGETYSVTKIESYAFKGCDNLSSIKMPNSITEIGKGAFWECVGLSSIIIPNSVRSIGEAAFYSCNITSISLPNSLTSIEAITFWGCNKLSSIVVPNSVTSIGTRAFSDCRGLISLTLSNSLVEMGEAVFEDCTLLESVVLPNGIKKIPMQTFWECKGLETVTLPNSLETIDYSAFYYCSKLKSISIPKSVKVIGSYAFGHCQSLIDIELTANITSIESNAFFGCINLEAIDIPNSVCIIGEKAFSYCVKLARVNSEIKSPFEISENVFQYISSNAVLHVPQGTGNKYQSFSGWTKNFKNITDVEEYAYYTLNIHATGNGSVLYDGTTICSKTSSFSVNEGTNAIIKFSPDNGYRIKNVKVNSSDVTSNISNNLYTVSNIQRNTTVEVEFEAIPSNIDITQYISAVSVGGSIMQTNNLINSGSQLNWTFSNNSSESVTLNSMQLIDGQSGSAGNIMTINQVVNANSSVSYTTTIGAAGIHTPVTCRFRYTYNGSEYSVDAKYTGNQGYSLSIKSTGNGQVKYNGKTIRNSTETYFVDFLSSATLTITPDDGYRIKSVRVNNSDVTSGVSNNSYTISFITSNQTVEVEFEEDAINSYTLSIKASGNGSASYDGTTIRSKTSTFTVNEGTNATISFSADNGYRIKSVKVNSSDITSIVSNNQYTVSNIQKNTTVEVEFEAIPVTTYTLSISSTGSGYASYDGTTIRSKTSTFTVNEGTNATISFNADNGYRIKSVKVNSTNVTSSVSNNQYTVSNIQSNTTVEVEFEAIPPTTYTLSVSSTGNGSASYDGTTIRGKTSTFTVKEGTNATVSFSADNGYRIKSVKVNSSDVTSSVSDNRYTVSNIKSNTTVGVEFEAIPSTIDITQYISAVSIGGAITQTNNLINSGSQLNWTFSNNSSESVTLNSMQLIDGQSGSAGNIMTVNKVVDANSSVSYTTTIGAAGIHTPVTCRFRYSYNGKEYSVDAKYTDNQGYTLSVKSSGNGQVKYNGKTIRNSTETYSVDFLSSATLTITPDEGYKIKSVKVNNRDVTSGVSNNSYTISFITSNQTVEVEFEEDTINSYTLSIKASGNGSASYDGTTIRSKTSTFTVNEGTNVTISFSADPGYRIKSVKVNSSDVTSSVSNNRYTVSNIQRNTTVEVEFEAIPPTTYALSISSMGNGYAFYDGTTIRSRTSSFTVTEGTNATIIFSADNGNRIKSVKVNSSDVTSSVSNNQYTISNVQRNTTVEVEFQEEVKSFAFGGLNYAVVSYDDKTVNLANGKYGTVLEVPATVTYQGVTWKVTGIDNVALANNEDLAAIIWNPDAAFTASVNNPNLLLYVNSANYAPAAIKNVVVNSIADNIVLTDAASGNTFYCPQEFIAKKISYTHNYGMITGIGESRGWETIALPFDVKKIAHSSKGELAPFANWKSGDGKKPFWLMSYGIGGWTYASSIKANTPYIISMPNNDNYKTEFRMNGNVTFSAEGVVVKKSDDLQKGSYNGNTLVPNFTTIYRNEILTLNVKNDYVSYTGGAAEGSMFVANLRPVHPFEAYMTTASLARRYISINDDMTTGIEEISVLMDESKGLRIYNLKGQLIKTEHGESIDEVGRLLPAGVYVVNGRKLIIK